MNMPMWDRGASVRADEGSPFFIGPSRALQDGVTLHGLKDKVILVQGRAYSIVGGSECLPDPPCA